MNHLLITNTKTQKSYTEERLAELLYDVGKSDTSPNKLLYENGKWVIHYRFSRNRFLKFYPLDPSIYTISFSDSMPLSKVGEMVGELYLLCVSMSEEPVTERFNSIRDKYI